MREVRKRVMWFHQRLKTRGEETSTSMCNEKKSNKVVLFSTKNAGERRIVAAQREKEGAG